LNDVFRCCDEGWKRGGFAGVDADADAGDAVRIGFVVSVGVESSFSWWWRKIDTGIDADTETEGEWGRSKVERNEQIEEGIRHPGDGSGYSP